LPRHQPRAVPEMLFQVTALAQIRSKNILLQTNVATVSPGVGIVK
jgi:hypothetical protein